MAFQLPMPCKNISDCFPCNDLPTTNVSSEAQDVLQDFVANWGNLQTNTPPLGTLFSANGCLFVCASSISQEDAFLCAQRQQVACVINNWSPTPQDPPLCLNFPCPPTVPPIQPPIERFGNQPESCSTHCQDGAPYTFTVPAGSFVADNQTLANRMASSFACREAILHKLCLNLATPFVCQDTASTLLFVATGPFLSPTNNFWELRSGALPPGFNFTSAMAGPTLSISGTPTTAGDYIFTIRVTTPNGDFAERPFTVTVDAITTADPLPDANVGAAYSQILTSTIIDGTWNVVDGDLPDGLTLATDGTLSGTATEDGDFTFTVQVGDEDTACEKVFHLTVAGCFIDNITPLCGSCVSSATGRPASANGGVFGNAGTGSKPWFYFNRIAQPTDNFAAIHPGATGLVEVCNANQTLAGLQGGDIFWLDTQTADARNLGTEGPPAGIEPLTMISNGSLLLGKYLGGSFNIGRIYHPASGTFLTVNTSPTWDRTQVVDMNEAETVAATLVKLAPPARKAAKVTGGSTVALVTMPAMAPGNAQSDPRKINNLNTVAGHWIDPASLGFLRSFISGTSMGAVDLGFDDTAQEADVVMFLNDNNVLAGILNDFNTGFSKGYFWTQSAGTVLVGPNGVNTTITGLNNNNIAVGVSNGVAFIYDGTIRPLTNFISPATGWTAFDGLVGITDDDFVFGSGTFNGGAAYFAAKICFT